MLFRSIEIPNIHPCINIPVRRNFLPNDLSNYFGYFTQPNDETFTRISAIGDGSHTPSAQSLAGIQSTSQLGPIPPQTLDLSLGSETLNPNPSATVSQESKIPVRNNVKYKRYVRKSDVPSHISLLSSPQGQYFIVNKEKIYVTDEDYVEPSESDKKKDRKSTRLNSSHSSVSRMPSSA